MADVYVIDPQIDAILKYCGFETQALRNRIAKDGIESIADLLKLDERDIDELNRGFSERTGPAKCVFGLNRVRKLKAAMHWAQDFARISLLPTLAGIPDMETFLKQIEVSRKRATSRKKRAEESSDKLTAGTVPKKLKSYKDWKSLRATSRTTSRLSTVRVVPIYATFSG